MSISESEFTLYKSQITNYRVQCAQSLSGRILDCGGGLGDYLPYLRGEVVSLDREIAVLEMLHAPAKVAASAHSLPFADNVFDGVWACAMAQYVVWERFFTEVCRVTKSGGRVLILVPNGQSIWDRMKTKLGMKGWWDQAGIVTHYSVEELALYGKVTGEVQFLPYEQLWRRFPRLGHTLMLDVTVE